MPNTYTRLASRTIGPGPAYQVALDNIPQTYSDLKVVILARSDFNATWDNGVGVFFNNAPTSQNYGSTWFRGTGTGTSSSRTLDIVTYMGLDNATNSTSNVWTSYELYIPNYSATTFRKSFTMAAVSESNTNTAYQQVTAGSWTQTSAISRIDFYGGQGNFIAGSRFDLYGILRTP